MIWILLAVLAHAGNALVFAVDKSLLGTSGQISQPVRYAAYSGLVAGAAVLLLPFDYVQPTYFVTFWSVLLGVFWVLALWLFFSALKAGEPSRVVPIAGSAVPLFTLVFAVTWLGEQLSIMQKLAVLLMIVGGVLLSVRLSKKRGLPAWALLAAILSGASFAAYFTAVKFMYDSFDTFLAAFAYSRLGVGVVAGALLVVLILSSSPHKVNGRPKQRQKPTNNWAIAAAFFGSKILAMGMLILLNYAISLGSVTVVNALQGVQYVFLLIIAAIVSFWWPNLFREEFSRVAMWQKVSGIVVLGLGIALLV